MAKKQQATADGDMVAKMEKMAEQASTWNNEITQGTEVAAIQDDGSRRIMWVSGPAMVGNDGVQAVLCANPPERVNDENGANKGCIFSGEEMMYPINRIRKRAVELRKKVKPLRVNLTDAEVRAMSGEMADKMQELEDKEKEAKTVAGDYKNTITGLETDISGRRNKIRMGYEMRPVETEIIMDFDTRRVLEVRKDNGSKLEDRMMREEEFARETSLFPELHQEPETPAETDQDAEQEDGAESSGSSEATAEPEVLDVGEAEIERAIGILRQTKRASVSGLQRRLNVGFIRAAQIMEALEVRGIVGPAKASGGNRDIIEGALEASTESDESSEG